MCVCKRESLCAYLMRFHLNLHVRIYIRNEFAGYVTATGGGMVPVVLHAVRRISHSSGGSVSATDHSVAGVGWGEEACSL